MHPFSPGGKTRAMRSAETPEAAVLVRPATEDELDLLVEQTWSVAAEGRFIGAEVPFDRARRRARLGELLGAETSTVLVADTCAAGGPGVVGHLTVSVAPYGVADIGMLLQAGWRGRGIGRALLDAAIAWATSAGAHKMSLEVWPDNAAAIALYERAGFVVEGRKAKHYRRRNDELWDSILMGRPLP